MKKIYITDYIKTQILKKILSKYAEVICLNEKDEEKIQMKLVMRMEY